MQTVNIRVFGIVQGVFFRKSTKEKADELGICGWARNGRDGSVEIMATGEKDVVEKFISWCKKGPPLSKVEKVEVDWLNQTENFEDFNVL